jgi:hypothetical protein
MLFLQGRRYNYLEGSALCGTNRTLHSTSSDDSHAALVYDGLILIEKNALDSNKQLSFLMAKTV